MWRLASQSEEYLLQPVEAGRKNCMRETAWGVCVVLCPVGQEPAADVSPSFTEVIIKKVQKSLISGWMFCF